MVTAKNNDTKNELMNTLLKERKELVLPLKPGDLVDARLVSREREGVFFDLGHNGTGIVYGVQLRQAARLLKQIKMGDVIPSKVVDPENDEGYVELSVTDAGEEMAWKDIREKKEKNETIEVKVSNANKGGLIAEVNGIPAFLPASQLASEHYPKIGSADPARLVQELRKLVDQTLEVKILDFDQKEIKLIISEKATREETLRGVLEKYHTGETVEGEITGVVDFGAFMKLAKDDVEGLIHISELDWRLVENPGDIVKTGEKVKAKIIDIRNGRISLSLKALKKDPWEDIGKKYAKGDVIKAKVVKFSPYGAFAELEKNIVGLAHISEFSSQKKMEETLELGKKYEFKIVLIDQKEHKIALSLTK